MPKKTMTGMLLCSNPQCNSEIKITLMESPQGVYVMHTYMCSNCGYIMSAEFTNEDYKQGGITG
jgi:hypothetical protein